MNILTKAIGQTEIDCSDDLDEDGLECYFSCQQELIEKQLPVPRNLLCNWQNSEKYLC